MEHLGCEPKFYLWNVVPLRRGRLPPPPVFWGFPGGSVTGKESACHAGDLGSIPGLGRSPGGRHGNPLQYSSLENPHGQRSLADYSPWGRKESDTTERLTLVIVVAFSPVPGPYYGLIR